MKKETNDLKKKKKKKGKVKPQILQLVIEFEIKYLE